MKRTLALLAPVLPLAPLGAAEQPKPNILVILVDDFGYCDSCKISTGGDGSDVR